jgi:hypothetical protein
MGRFDDRAFPVLLAAALVCGAGAGARAELVPKWNQSTLTDAQAVISSWPEAPKKAAQALILEYGRPDGVARLMLVWHDRGVWKRVAVFRRGPRNASGDILENTVSYIVPRSKVALLAEFDKAIVVDRAARTLSVRSGSETDNTLTLNLADEIIRGKRGVASARIFRTFTMAKEAAGKSSPYTEKLLFTPLRAGITPESPAEQAQPKERSVP